MLFIFKLHYFLNILNHTRRISSEMARGSIAVQYSSIKSESLFLILETLISSHTVLHLEILDLRQLSRNFILSYKEFYRVAFGVLRYTPKEFFIMSAT